MKKLILILLAAYICTSCSMMFTAANVPHAGRQSLPEAVSTDPYDGHGTKAQYLRLAREWESRSLEYEAGAMSQREYMRSAARSAYSAVASQVKNGSRNASGYGYAASSVLSGRSRMLQCQNNYEKYMEHARQAKAEQQKYLRLADAAKR